MFVQNNHLHSGGLLSQVSFVVEFSLPDAGTKLLHTYNLSHSQNTAIKGTCFSTYTNTKSCNVTGTSKNSLVVNNVADFSLIKVVETYLIWKGRSPKGTFATLILV